MHWYGIEPGDKLRVVNHGREVFSGVILTVRAGRRGDRQRHGMVSDKIRDHPAAGGRSGAGRGAADVRQGGDRRRNHRPAAHPDLPGVGRVHPGADPGGHPGHLLRGDGTHLPPGGSGKALCRWGRCRPSPSLPTTSRAENLGAFDITLAKGSVSGSDSMAELTNSVVLAAGGESAETLGRAYNSASIAKYGLLQAVETLPETRTPPRRDSGSKRCLPRATGSPGSGLWMKSGGGRGGERYPPAIPAKQLRRDRGAAGHRRHPPLWTPPPDESDGGGPPIPGPLAAGTPLPFEEDSMGAWDYELARELRGLGRGAGRTEILEGRWYPSIR